MPPSTHPLPDLYAGWLAALLPEPMPSERLATCDDCAMCVKPDGTVPTSAYTFDAEVKCCVYLPRLANFLVGQILGDDRPDQAPGRATVEARIDAGIAVTPLGLGRPPSYDLLYRNSVNAIGRSRSLRCPHYLEDGGRCGIWSHRDALCATWFCRHERGRVGMQLWSAVRDLLATVERELARWAALEEGIDAGVLVAALPRTEHDNTPEPLPDGLAVDGVPDEAVATALWGPWRGRERDFYRACAARVGALDWSEVLGLCGTEVAVRARLVAERYDAHAVPAIPERVRVGRFEVIATRAGGCRVVTHSSLDALDLPSQLVALLPLFDGRPTVEVLSELRARHRVELDGAFLQVLVDWGVLVAGPGA